MKYSLLVIAVLSATFTTACANHKKADSAPGVDLKKELEKTAWISSCQQDGMSRGVSSQSQLSFKDGIVISTSNFFATPDCSGSAVNSRSEKNGYTVDNAKSSVQLLNEEAGSLGNGALPMYKTDKLSVKLAGKKLTVTRIDAAGNLSGADYVPMAPVAAGKAPVVVSPPNFDQPVIPSYGEPGHTTPGN